MAQDSRRWMKAYFTSAVSTQAQIWQPLVDIYRTSRGWLLKYDLAGVLAEDVILSIHGQQVTIRGTRRDCCLGKDCVHYLLEISYSYFERTIELPETIDRAQIRTEFRNGMLLVRLEMEARS